MSKINKRSVTIAGHSTSISLEEEFWTELQNIAAAESISLAALIARVDSERVKTDGGNLSSALRVYVLKNLLTQ